jgi:hydroxymethylpyrimidine pyrophosphatase-like HAD family hydrolase
MDMLAFVGIGVAMGNAQERVKDIADYVTADVDDDGIEKALRYWRVL